MTPTQYNFLRGLVANRSAQLRSAIAREMAATQDLGRLRGMAVHYGPSDFVKAETKLRNAGFSLEAPVAGGARADARDAASEKLSAAAVTDGLVAVVPLGLPGISNPPGSFLAMHWQDALALPYEVLVVCENLEPMRRMHRYAWMSEYLKGRSALATFRGAPSWFRVDCAAQLVKADTRPVLALFDFDPQGLVMAAALPRRESLCLPPWEVLEPLVIERKRHDLFAAQEAGCRAILDACQEKDLAQAWARIRRLTRGLNQEAFPEL
ncbi:hypothetical protein SAMN05444679_103126 [Variovorax sp. CF079]|uniref:DUF7281 domain-containing protein n=1 Tax=Variovorax sp. CF079 TaxID=1882774 RepID=UPI000888D5E6|nr:hypothetical protein [Variovorax sp. CF079]SDC46048.1 hypothetical protein SAMN05444679_103126 [Variovorax sp. CF079]